jgi:hypothetical protein
MVGVVDHIIQIQIQGFRCHAQYGLVFPYKFNRFISMFISMYIAITINILAGVCCRKEGENLQKDSTGAESAIVFLLICYLHND